MSIDFKLPELGENIESGDVVNVLVHEGDQIEANDGVIELETDKAVVEIPCAHAGRVAKLHVKKGDTVKVGQTLLTVETEAAATAKAPETSAPAAAPKPVATATAVAGPKAPSPAAPTLGGPIPAGPAARRVARELGVDLQQVRGSGKYGRITPEDVQGAAGTRGLAETGGVAGAKRSTAPAHAAAGAPLRSAPATLPATPPGEPGQDPWGPVRREKISRIRRTIADQMVRSASTAPHVTNFDDADITDLEQLRQGVPAGYLGENVRLTQMPFLMKAVAMALRRHPALNANFDEEHEQIVYKEYVNLGVAVDTPRGLVVPNVRNADQMGIVDTAKALASLAQRARAVQFAVEDLRGGTFTISNLGAIGGTYSTPIINFPEVAILLVGRSRWMPVVRGENHDRVEPRLMMPLSLSYDHRLVDGATAGRFLNEVIQFLQAPALLLLR
jgi:pyruvate dehydrogenase E2 component (dihydrolipoamide acetyltransferase)